MRDKLRRGSGVEWIPVYASLTILFSLMVVVTYYYTARSEARKLALALSHVVVLDHKYDNHFTELKLNNKELREESKEVAEKVQGFLNSYGENAKYYIKQSPIFAQYRLAFQPIEDGIQIFLNNGSVILVDRFRYMVTRRRVSNEEVISYLDPLPIQNKIFSSYFLPYPLALPDDKNRYNKKWKDLFTNHIDQIKLSNNTRKRVVIDQEKTTKAIEKIVEDYNKFSRRKGAGYFKVTFAKTHVDFIGNSEAAFQKKVTANNDSFFFFSRLENGVMDVLDYRIQSQSNNKDYYIQFDYPNSLHLVLYFEMPMWKGVTLRYALDISAEQEVGK